MSCKATDDMYHEAKALGYALGYAASNLVLVRDIMESSESSLDEAMRALRCPTVLRNALHAFKRSCQDLSLADAYALGSAAAMLKAINSYCRNGGFLVSLEKAVRVLDAPAELQDYLFCLSVEELLEENYALEEAIALIIREESRREAFLVSWQAYQAETADAIDFPPCRPPAAAGACAPCNSRPDTL